MILKASRLVAKEKIGAKQAAEHLNKYFPEVAWDRYVNEEPTVGFTLYGWIDREGDSYKDFVLITFDDFGDFYYYTSSAKYSNIFHERIHGEGASGHTDCIRVEDSFPDIKNVVRLKK